MLKLSDQEIIEEIRNGNTRVFKVLYNDFDKITSFVRNNSGGEEEAKDFFHETLLIFYEKVKSEDFKLEAKLSTYLYSVCRNLWLNNLRKNKSVIFAGLDENLKMAVGNVLIEEENDEDLYSEENASIIMAKIEEMEEPCHSILMMYYFKKLSFAQIAERLKYKTEKVVKNQKYRCIQKIKEAILT